MDSGNATDVDLYDTDHCLVKNFVHVVSNSTLAQSIKNAVGRAKRSHIIHIYVPIGDQLYPFYTKSIYLQKANRIRFYKPLRKGTVA